MATGQRHFVTKSAEQSTEPYASLLIAIDLSRSTERIIERAMLLPLVQGAQLQLIHVLPKALPAWMRSAAVHSANQRLKDVARTTQNALQGKAKVTSIVSTGAPEKEIARQARKHRAEMVVMGRGGGRALGDLFLGSTSERVLRQSQIPVLVVRLPAHDEYRRPLIALEKDSPAAQAISATLRILPRPRPTLAVVHAYDLPYVRSAYRTFTKDEEQNFNDECQRQGLRDMARLVATAMGRGDGPMKERLVWRTHVRLGSPRRVIRQTAARTHADLLVLGTHGRTGLAYGLLGSVAGDVLREVPCDVLVVPPGKAKRRRTPK